MNRPNPIARLATGPQVQWHLAPVIACLRATRERWRAAHQRLRESGGREFPSREALEAVVQDLCGVLYPMRLGPPNLHQESEDDYIGHTLDRTLNALLGQIRLELADAARKSERDTQGIEIRAVRIVREFLTALPAIRAQLDADVDAAFRGDPAARSVDEVVLCYPGVLAIIHHRLAHRIYRMGAPLVARIISEIAHGKTGIDIHPGAQIGEGFFIDHGTGVVIGETAVIGRNVRLYQAVTLGAKHFPLDDQGSLQKGLPRHPVVEDDVVIYAGATVLGRIVIGRGSTIGGNVWLTHSLPAGTRITQADSRHAAAHL